MTRKKSISIAPSLYNGLIANYKLDETSGTTAIDETGIYNGIINGTPTLGVASNLGTGYNFNNNAANFVDLQTRNLIGGKAAFTIAAWSTKNTDGASGTVYGSWAGTRICSFGDNGVNPRYTNYIYIGGLLKGGVFNFTASEFTNPSHGFQLMISYYDGATFKTSVNNNESLDSYLMTGNVQSTVNSQNERIGFGNVPSNRIIPSLQIWDRAITADERTNLWNGGSGIIL